MRATSSFLALLVVTTALAGCDLAPKFRLPETAQSPAYKEAHAEAEPFALPPGEPAGVWKTGRPAAAQPRGEWWRVFGDDRLNALEEEAAAGNQNVHAMVSRVTQARETAAIADAGLFPSVNNTTTYTRRQPNAVGRGLAAGTSLAIENDYNTSFGLSYELDLFGRVKNARKAAREDAATAQETLRSVTLAIQADVASLYFTLRGLDREKDLLQRALKLRQESLDILKKRQAAGDITELDVAGNIVDLETTRQQVQALTQQRAQTEHALAVLLGKPPSAFSLEPGTLAKKNPTVPPGLPSALLERRPDIAAAQHSLAAANARIGIARAAFFPSLSLTGSGGFQSSVLPDLFHWSSRSWAVGPLLSLPVFSGGTAVANNKRSRAIYEEAVAIYRQTVLDAFRDVEDSLSRLEMLARQDASQNIAEKAAKRAEYLSDKRYNNGDISYLDAITARRQSLDIRRNGIQIERKRLAETVQLIRALGGGWDDEAVKQAVSGAPAASAINPATKADGFANLIHPSSLEKLNK